MANVETDAAEIDSIQYYAQANDAAVSSPAAGLVKGYFVGNEQRIKNSAGGVTTWGGADATELTIATGAITRTQLYHKVDTQADAASDDLDTINGGVASQHLYLRAENTARTVVIKHNTGNILTGGINDIALDDTSKVVHLLFDGSDWLVIGYHVFPNDVQEWGAAPDYTLKFAAQFTDGTMYAVDGDEIRSWTNYAITADITIDFGVYHFVFNSATDRTVTINAGTINDGMPTRATAIQVSGGTGHKLLLPANTYWGSSGSNRAAIFDAVDDTIEAVAFDAGGGVMRFLYGANDVSGVTFAAS